MKFIPYTSLQCWQGSADEFLTNYEQIRDAAIKSVNCLTDGLVVEVISETLKLHMGNNSHHHRWQVACKEIGETAEVLVTDITAQTGRTGRVTPLLHYAPTKLSGAVLSKATAHNPNKLIDCNINIGTTIQIVHGSGSFIVAAMPCVNGQAPAGSYGHRLLALVRARPANTGFLIKALFHLPSRPICDAPQCSIEGATGGSGAPDRPLLVLVIRLLHLVI